MLWLLPLAALAYAAMQLRSTQTTVGALPATTAVTGRVRVLLQLPTLSPPEARSLMRWASKSPSVQSFNITLPSAPNGRTVAHASMVLRRGQTLRVGEPMLIGGPGNQVPVILLNYVAL